MKALVLVLFFALVLAAKSPEVKIVLADDPNISVLHKSMVRKLVSKMYDEIGVTIRWERYRKKVPPGGIKVDLRNDTPLGLMPGAMAYALPYEGTRIVVFYDRIAPKPESVYFLAHVIAHEIGHILEGIATHARSGIMKADWTADEKSRMRSGSLGFAPLNAERILRGAEDRSRQQVAASR